MLIICMLTNNLSYIDQNYNIKEYPVSKKSTLLQEYYFITKD
jgi:hypothetical protein